tara:strand:+ start:60 stop:641 length:582 start_codon:yes stop_codon:yes gene_type:complete
MTTPTPENLQRRLRRIVTQGRSRLGERRHNLFEPDILKRSNMNFVEVSLPSNSNNREDFITGKNFKVGDEAVEYGKQKKKYMSLKSFKEYIKPRTLENGTNLRRASSPHLRTIYNTPPTSNNNMLENTHTREFLKRRNIRFVKFTEPRKILAIKSTIKQLEKELNVLRKTNTQPKKIQNKKNVIKKLKEKLKA